MGVNAMTSGSLFCALLCSLLMFAPASAQPPTNAKNVLEYISTRPDTRIFAGLLGYFPYLQQVFANPKFKATIFVPTDASWYKDKQSWIVQGTPSVAAALASFADSLKLDPSVTNREEVAQQFFWIALNQHIVLNKAMSLGSLNNATTLIDESITVERRTKGGVLTVTVSNSERDAKVVRSTKVGSAWVHLVDNVLNPFGIAPPDSFSILEEALRFNEVVQPIFNASDYWELLNGPWKPYLAPSLTVFLPSDGAVEAFLAARNQTLDAFVANKTAVNAFVAAHVVARQRLWLPNLMNLALVYGSNVPVKGVYTGRPELTMLSGQKFGVATNLSNVFLVPSQGPQLAVSTVTDLAGTSFGCLDEECSDWGSVVLALEGVLPH